MIVPGRIYKAKQDHWGYPKRFLKNDSIKIIRVSEVRAEIEFQVLASKAPSWDPNFTFTVDYKDDEYIKPLITRNLPDWW